jgi:hypothetical protein
MTVELLEAEADEAEAEGKAWPIRLNPLADCIFFFAVRNYAGRG